LAYLIDFHRFTAEEFFEAFYDSEASHFDNMPFLNNIAEFYLMGFFTLKQFHLYVLVNENENTEQTTNILFTLLLQFHPQADLQVQDLFYDILESGNSGYLFKLEGWNYLFPFDDRVETFIFKKIEDDDDYLTLIFKLVDVEDVSLDTILRIYNKLHSIDSISENFIINAEYVMNRLISEEKIFTILPSLIDRDPDHPLIDELIQAVTLEKLFFRIVDEYPLEYFKYLETKHRFRITKAMFLNIKRDRLLAREYIAAKYFPDFPQILGVGS
jgi:hypothetical protein